MLKAKSLKYLLFSVFSLFLSTVSYANTHLHDDKSWSYMIGLTVQKALDIYQNEGVVAVEDFSKHCFRGFDKKIFVTLQCPSIDMVMYLLNEHKENSYFDKRKMNSRLKQSVQQTNGVKLSNAKQREAWFYLQNQVKIEMSKNIVEK